MTDSTIKHIATVFPIDAKALEPDPKFRRRRSIIREFSLNTSTHGIPGIARSQNIHNRIFWIVSTLIFTGIMLFFIVESMKAYFNYPTQTSVSFIVERSQAFPAVSICNYSPMRFDNFIEPFLNFTKSRNLTYTNDTSTISEEQSRYIRDFIQNLLRHGEPVDSYFFPISSMLISCLYNGQRCQTNDFIPFYSSSFGRCYTFNAKMKLNQSSVRNTTDNGGPGKLELQLYAHSHQYIPYVVKDVSVGMMAMIHDNTELPLIEVAGIQLEPGREYKLSYKKKIYQLLPSPYSDCTNKIPLVIQAMFNRYAGADYAYSQVLCYTLCIQTYVYDECKCVSPFEWIAQSIVLSGTDQIREASLCNVTDQCYMTATARITTTDSIWNQFCSDCSQACSTVDFTITTSAVSAPSTTYVPVIKKFVEKSGIILPKNWSNTWQSEIPKNYLAVDIVCETTRVETYTQDASISGVDLLSNVGGHTGLWIGISFLSIMELVEMLYRLIRYDYYILKEKIRRRNQEQS
ncbi:unnamed protein product [Rotaria sordida]|uniref:Uncharacterized protein n=1 Tax=Rotaria sordida TaxID=392033 RepID=A0A814UEX8_9BILA|nr:unnamed protein product [Rotaria sordida]CAF1429954.1 unnamed protein product [Rotaria sordida]